MVRRFLCIGCHLLPRLTVIIGLLCGSLVFAQSPVFTAHPQNQTTRLGQDISLRCAVSPPAPLFWIRNELPLISNTTYIFRFSQATGEHEIIISNISMQQDGEFWCRVMGPNGKPIRSQGAFVNVQVPPTHIKLVPFSPVSILQENSKASLTCITSAKPAPTIQWFKDDAAIEVGVDTRILPDDGSKIENVTSTFKWRPIREDHEKRIYCTATHPALQGGPLRAQTQLSVEYAPGVKLVSVPEVVKEGDAVILQCLAEANPYFDLKFRWTKNGQPVSDSAVGSLHIDAAQRSERPVVYTCEATNRVGTSSATFNLDVQYAPTFYSMPEVKGADLQDEVFLNCNVDSNPAAVITWTRDTSSKVLSTDTTLQFRASSASDFGVYVCQATAGPNFVPVRKTVRVLQNASPFISAEVPVYAGQGESSIEIKCHINGLPGPDTVRWTKANDPHARVLNSLVDSRIEVRQENLNPDRVISHLTIKNVNKDDFGLYNCTAGNIYGTSYQLISLKETDWMVPIIAGSVCGGTLLLAIIVVSAIFCIRCRSHNRLKEKASDTSGSTTTSDDLDVKSGISNGGMHRHHHGGPLDMMYSTTSHETLMETAGNGGKNHHHHSWSNGTTGRRPHEQDIPSHPYTIHSDYASRKDTPQNYYTRYADYDPNTEYNPNTFIGLPAIYTPTLSLAEQQDNGQEPIESRDPSPYHPTGLPLIEPVYGRYPAGNGSALMLDATLQSRLATNV